MEAQRIKASADEEAKAKLDENEIMRESRAKAEELLGNSRRECEELVREAEKTGDKVKLEAGKFAQKRKAESDDYAQDVLYNLEQELSNINLLLFLLLELRYLEQTALNIIQFKFGIL